MKVNPEEFKNTAELVKSNETYDIYDYKMDRLVISMTVLHPGKETRGHAHNDIEETYVFLEGRGQMQVGEKPKIEVEPKDIVIIPEGDFHKVFNPGDSDLVFLAIFEKYERK